MKTEKNNIKEYTDILYGIGILGTVLVGALASAVRLAGQSRSLRNTLSHLFGIDKLSTEYLKLDEFKINEIKKIVEDIIYELEDNYEIISITNEIRNKENETKKILDLFEKFKKDLPNKLKVNHDLLSSAKKRREYFEKNPNTKISKEYYYYIKLYPKIKSDTEQLYMDLRKKIGKIITKNTGKNFDSVITKAHPEIKSKEIEQIKEKYLSLIKDRSEKFVTKMVKNRSDDSVVLKNIYNFIKEPTDPFSS